MKSLKCTCDFDYLWEVTQNFIKQFWEIEFFEIDHEQQGAVITIKIRRKF